MRPTIVPAPVTAPEAPPSPPADTIYTALDRYVDVEVKTRLDRRARELHRQIVALIAGHPPIVVLGVLHLVADQVATQMRQEP